MCPAAAAAPSSSSSKSISALAAAKKVGSDLGVLFSHVVHSLVRRDWSGFKLGGELALKLKKDKKEQKDKKEKKHKKTKS